MAGLSDEQLLSLSYLWWTSRFGIFSAIFSRFCFFYQNFGHVYCPRFVVSKIEFTILEACTSYIEKQKVCRKKVLRLTEYEHPRWTELTIASILFCSFVRWKHGMIHRRFLWLSTITELVLHSMYGDDWSRLSFLRMLTSLALLCCEFTSDEIFLYRAAAALHEEAVRNTNWVFLWRATDDTQNPFLIEKDWVCVARVSFDLGIRQKVQGEKFFFDFKTKWRGCCGCVKIGQRIRWHRPVTKNEHVRSTKVRMKTKIVRIATHS